MLPAVDTGTINTVADRRLDGYRAALRPRRRSGIVAVVEGFAYDHDEMTAVARDLLDAPTGRPACWR